MLALCCRLAQSLPVTAQLSSSTRALSCNVAAGNDMSIVGNNKAYAINIPHQYDATNIQ